MPQAPDNTSLDFPRLIDDAITEALVHEDPDRFLAWFREHLADYWTGSGDENPLDAAFAALLGRSIWNALPLPGHGFRPDPLPEPGRNDPCPCGSGRKYKQCCAGRPVLDLDPDAILPSVLDRMDPDTLAARLRAGRVPVAAVADLARRRFERGELWNTIDLLEPLFAGEIRSADERYSPALDLLCDVYTQLGHDRRKADVLARLVESPKRSPLRADAWQRLAVARLDGGDADGAWEAFHRARQDNPDDPGIGLLEIQLLMSRGRADEARERAGFWQRRLKKQGFREDHRLLDFLDRMTDDPYAVMADMGVKAAGGAGERLVEWLRKVSDRPVPDYQAAADDAPAPDGNGPPTLHLAAPAARHELEDRWHAVFPLGKPESADESPAPEADPWEPHCEQTWMDFLEEHSAAFDSLDILDDLAAALAAHPQYGANWLDHVLLAPILTRAEAIIDRALADQPASHLSRRSPDNRPALRTLARLVDLETRRGNEVEANRARERIRALDPEDSAGPRQPTSTP